MSFTTGIIIEPVTLVIEPDNDLTVAVLDNPFQIIFHVTVLAIIDVLWQCNTKNRKLQLRKGRSILINPGNLNSCI